MSNGIQTEIEIADMRALEEIASNAEIVELVTRIAPSNLSQVEQSQAPDKRFEQPMAFNPSVLSSVNF